ncbi:MAG: hypothetical protein IJ524_07575 [Bacteroidales bacterium]|nr:hypothetical protein [Bacteroidales bacterium]
MIYCSVAEENVVGEGNKTQRVAFFLCDRGKKQDGDEPAQDDTIPAE